MVEMPDLGREHVQGPAPVGSHGSRGRETEASRQGRFPRRAAGRPSRARVKLNRMVEELVHKPRGGASAEPTGRLHGRWVPGLSQGHDLCSAHEPNPADVTDVAKFAMVEESFDLRRRQVQEPSRLAGSDPVGAGVVQVASPGVGRLGDGLSLTRRYRAAVEQLECLPSTTPQDVGGVEAVTGLPCHSWEQTSPRLPPSTLGGCSRSSPRRSIGLRLPRDRPRGTRQVGVDLFSVVTSLLKGTAGLGRVGTGGVLVGQDAPHAVEMMDGVSPLGIVVRVQICHARGVPGLEVRTRVLQGHDCADSPRSLLWIPVKDR